MKDVIFSIDWVKVWEIVALPIAAYLIKTLDEYIKTTKYNQIYSIIKSLAREAVKDIWEYYVKEIKGTDKWTEDTKERAKEMAIQEIIKGLSNEAYTLLKEKNQDFESYLSNAVEGALYDIRLEAKANEQH